MGEPEIRISHWPTAATPLLQILLRPFNPVIAVALVSDSEMEGGVSADKTHEGQASLIRIVGIDRKSRRYAWVLKKFR